MMQLRATEKKLGDKIRHLEDNQRVDIKKQREAVEAAEKIKRSVFKLPTFLNGFDFKCLNELVLGRSVTSESTFSILYNDIIVEHTNSC